MKQVAAAVVLVVFLSGLLISGFTVIEGFTHGSVNGAQSCSMPHRYSRIGLLFKPVFVTTCKVGAYLLGDEFRE